MKTQNPYRQREAKAELEEDGETDGETDGEGEGEGKGRRQLIKLYYVRNESVGVYCRQIIIF